MSLRINNNIASLNGHRNLVRNDAMVSKSLERLSSGMRINRASDDAAGLIISEQMRAQLRGIEQALANSEQGVTMVQTAEGALDEVSNLLSKARQLALHAANEGINDTNQLAADQQELDNIVDSVNRIAVNTQFGTKKILDGSLNNGVSNNTAINSVKLGGDYTSLVSASTGQRGFHSLNITQSATQASNTVAMANSADVWANGSLLAASGNDQVLKSFTMSVNGAQIAVSSGTTKNQLIQQLNSVGQQIGFTAAISGAGTGNIVLTARDYGRSFDFNVGFVSGATGASTLANTEVSGIDTVATLIVYSGQNGVNGTAFSGGATTINFSATGGSTFQGGVGLTLVSSGGSQIVLTTNVVSGLIVGAVDGTTAGAVFQVGANVGQSATVQLGSVQASQLGNGGSGVYQSLQQLRGVALISGNANEAIRVIDKAINDVTVQRGGLGAFQANTLETTINSLRISYENLTTAESTIRDVDFAAESAKFTKNNILVQSATAMLAQANQLPQNVLKLLQ